MGKKSRESSLLFVVVLFIFISLISHSSMNNEEKNKDTNLKVISLSPAVTETLFYYGLGESVIGRTEFCVTPKEVENIEKMGSMLAPNVEKIVFSSPDYIVWQSHYDSRMREQLEKMGIKTLFFDTPKSVEEILKQHEKILSIFKEQDESLKLKFNLVKEQLDIMRKKGEEMPKRPKIYYSLGSGHIEYTAGRDSFINDIINIAGGENIVEENGWSYPLEALIEKQPDFIIISKIKYDAMLKSGKYEQLKVLKNEKRVIFIEEDEITLATPRLLTDTLGKIQKTILNSDFFN